MLRLSRHFLAIKSGQHLSRTPIRVNSSYIAATALQPTPDHRQKERLLFNQCFERILLQLTDNEFNKESNELFKANQWLRKVIEYNVPNGKQNRGLMAVLTYDIMAAPEHKTDEHMERVRAVGWALELFQTYFLILDDLMDGSITRRGQKCWYRNDYVGLMACNDATLIETGIYTLIKQHFRDSPCYIHLVELVQEMFRKTAYGQCMDMLSQSGSGTLDLNSYTADRYSMIVKYKTSYYSLVLPVRIAMYMSGNSSNKDHSMVEQILLRMGHLYQTQDDYLDCFGEEKVIGKIGTDIEDGKCSWNVVTALQICSREQRQLMQENYGHKERECVLRVKQVYEEIGLSKVFEEYENGEYETILQMIKAFGRESHINRNIFDEPLRIVNKRRG